MLKLKSFLVQYFLEIFTIFNPTCVLCYFVAIKQVTTAVPKTIRENIINQAATILACYRQHCAAPSSAGQVSVNITRLDSHSKSDKVVSHTQNLGKYALLGKLPNLLYVMSQKEYM